MKFYHLEAGPLALCHMVNSRAAQVRELVRKCRLTKKVADLRICRLWQFKLRTCGSGLFLILVRNFASFIQILKFLSIIIKYLCFYLVKHDDSIKFFRVQVRYKNIKFFKFRLTKILSLLFDLFVFCL